MAMLPRLKRFADVLVGARKEGTALLSRALARMLLEQHRYQRGTVLEVWAFAEIYRHWLSELCAHENPMGQARIDDASFERLFPRGDDDYYDAPVGTYLCSLPPQQRLTLLLVYGEGFDHADTGRVLDVSAEVIAARLLRSSAILADRLSPRAQVAQTATVETLYPDAPRESS